MMTPRAAQSRMERIDGRQSIAFARVQHGGRQRDPIGGQRQPLRRQQRRQSPHFVAHDDMAARRIAS